jgi:membrane-associated phospholipid phosphatase
MKFASSRVVGCCCAVAIAGGLTTRQAFAQAVPEAPTTTTTVEAVAPVGKPDLSVGKLLKDTVGDFRRLPSKESLTILAIGGMFAASSHPYDQRITAGLAGTGVGTAVRHEAYEPGRVIGGAQFQFGAAIATYGFGRFAGKTRVAETGAHLLRAQIVAQVVTHTVKYSVQRMRPDGSTRNSFPSGHTSVSFASATVLQQEFGWKVGIPAYAVASYIGVSRIGNKRHYFTDVAFGAAIGLVAGRSVGMTIADKRFVMSPTATRGGGGVSFVWTGQR